MSFLQTAVSPGSTTLHSNGTGTKAAGHGQLRKSSSSTSVLTPLVRLVRNPILTLGCMYKTLPELYLPGAKVAQAESDPNKQLLYVKLKNASSYDEWRAAATELDKLEGNDAWKHEDVSPEYDASLVEARLKQLDDARLSCDVRRMLFLIRTSLTRDLGGMGDLRLYKHSYIGTKRLIERYIETARATLASLLELTSSRDEPQVEPRFVLEQLLAARQAFGRSALLLSGGGTFGMNHIGVVKTLWYAKLLPRIISGSSAGSIVCAVLCTKADAEIPSVLENFFDGDMSVFETEGEDGILRKAARFLKIGALFEITNLVRIMRDLLGDITFQEAYNRTRRILNITVSSASVYELPRLLNYVTAPNVLIWSAVAASCSVPLVFSAAQLMAKDPRTGDVVPWNPSPQRWIDGSVDNDLPITRLAELFNVNHFIVSQVNPHVVPFLVREEDTLCSAGEQSASAFSPGPGWLHSMASLAKVEALHRMHVLAELGIFPNYFTKVRSVLSQRYSGDITIVPEISYTEFPRVLSNPTSVFMIQAMLSGERATWPKLSRIQNHCAIELALDDAVQQLRAHVVFSPSQVDLRLHAMTSTRSLNRHGSDRGRSSKTSRGRHKGSRSTEPLRNSKSHQHINQKALKPTLDIPLKYLEPRSFDTYSNHGKVPGPDGHTSSGESSPSLLSDNDPDNHSPTSCDSPPSPLPDLWPSTRQLFPSLSQPNTPGMSWRNPYPPQMVAPSLTMTSAVPTTSPSAPEANYKRIFHPTPRHGENNAPSHRPPTPGPSIPDPTRTRPRSGSNNLTTQGHLRGHVRSEPYTEPSAQPATSQPSASADPDRVSMKSERSLHRRRSSGQQSLQLDISGTRGMMLRRKRSRSSGLKSGLKSLMFGTSASRS